MRKRKFAILVIIVAFVFVLYLQTTSNNKSNLLKQITPLQDQATYNDIVPGVSNKSDVVKILGEPINNKNENVLEFKSSADGKPHFIEFENNNVSIIRETVTLNDSVRIKDITNTYGETPHILFDSRSLGGFYLFVYPKDGLAYIGHPESGLLLEIWYFPATNIENFQKKYAAEYSTSDIPNQF